MRDSINLIYADCYDWEFDYENDLKIIGVIVQKEYTDDNSLISFDIKLVEQSKSDIDIYGRTYQTGDTLMIWANTSWKLTNEDKLLPTPPKLY